MRRMETQVKVRPTSQSLIGALARGPVTGLVWVSLAVVLTDRLRPYASLRLAAEECGVHASTLSRVSRGAEPDLYTFGRLWDWMRVEVEIVGVRVVEAGEER